MDLENIDGHQMIMDEFGNCVWVDQDRSFFVDDRHCDHQLARCMGGESKAAISGVSA